MGEIQFGAGTALVDDHPDAGEIDAFHHRAPVAGGDRLAGRAACTYSLQERSAGGSPAGRPVRQPPSHYRRDVDQRAAADADAAGRAPAVAGPQVASQAMIARIASVADARISCSSTRLRVRRRFRARDILSKSVIGEAEVGVRVTGQKEWLDRNEGLAKRRCGSQHQRWSAWSRQRFAIDKWITCRLVS